MKIKKSMYIFFGLTAFSLSANAESTLINELVNHAKNSLKEIGFNLYEYFHLGDFESWRLIIFTFGLLITVFAAKFARWLIEKKLHGIVSRTNTEVDNLILDSLGKPFSLIIFITGLYYSSIPLFILFNTNLVAYYGRICLAGIASSVAWMLYRGVSVLEYLLKRIASKTENTIDDMIVSVMRRTLRVVICIISILFIGQNILHLNITALLAGAGVAGLAIAFAAQDTISNFFGSIMIILDRPFKIGEMVLIGSTRGIVEAIGFRSTRIRTLDGHLVTIPNKKLADTEIENISKRPSIRLVLNLTVTYDTTPEKMQRALDILHEIFDGHECCDTEKPPRIFFNAFNEWSLNIMVIAWYHSNDFFAFQEWNHRNNMEILKRFNAEGIDFAFPTNTTYLAGDPKRKLEISLLQK